jgi:hypothetical protein
VRKRGFPRFPDPLATYGPGFTLGRGEYFPLVSTNELQSSAFTQAANACEAQLPSRPLLLGRDGYRACALRLAPAAVKF